MEVPTFESYLGSLGRLTMHVDPTASSPEALEITEAAASLAALPTIDAISLGRWVRQNPQWIPVLGLAVGLSRERLRNSLRHRFDRSNWMVVGRTDPDGLVLYLDEDFDLLRLLSLQRSRTYDFGDLLNARAGSRTAAIRAGASGRRVEDEIERIAVDLGLPYEARARFEGRNGRSAPCDLAIPSATDADIVVAAKGFDSTGSQLTDAVREIEEMAEVRLPRQVVIAVIDGIGWKSRQSDLRRIHSLWQSRQIDGMYTLATLRDFRANLESAARLRGLVPPD